jgi:hypothetical protein
MENKDLVLDETQQTPGEVAPGIPEKEPIESERSSESAQTERDEGLEQRIERAVERAIAKAGVTFQGAVAGETGREAPDKRVDFSKLSYSELCAILENHPNSKTFL